MPNKNSVSSCTPHHSLCSEVAQMTHGHIGFGCYPALHGNEEGTLLAQGIKMKCFMIIGIFMMTLNWKKTTKNKTAGTLYSVVPTSTHFTRILITLRSSLVSANTL